MRRSYEGKNNLGPTEIAAGVFLFAGTWPLACQANEATAEYERYKQRRQIEGRLFRTGLHRFGNQLRAGAIAAACNKKELVDSLGPSPEDVSIALRLSRVDSSRPARTD